VRALVWLVLQLAPVGELAEGSAAAVVQGEEEAVAAAAHLEVPQGVLPDARLVVPVVRARQVAHQAVPGLEALLHLGADLAAHPEPAKFADPLG
jgi:hypothetical protein